MLRNILKYDYCLAEWFVPKKRVMGIEPMVSFLFLTKVSFAFFAFYFTFISYLPFRPASEIVITILVGVVLFIMCGFHNAVARSVKKYELRKEYKCLTKGERRKRNAIGLFLMFFVYLGACFVAIVMVG